MKSEIYLFDKKIGKMTKKLREKQKFRYPTNDYNDVMVTSKFLEINLIALKLNKQNPTLLFNIWIYNFSDCNIYSFFLG